MLISNDPVYVAMITEDEFLSILQVLDLFITGDFSSDDIIKMIDVETIREKLWNAFNRVDLRSTR